MRIARLAAVLLLAAAPCAAPAQPDSAARIAAEIEAMERLAFMEGVWRGPAWALLPSGRREFVQTERVGPFLGGSVRVVEGRGYDLDGTVAFNALGIISYDPDSRSYSIRAWAQGQTVDSALRVEGSRVIWESPAGPGAVIRHSATIENGRWHETSELVAGDAPPRLVAELDLRRVADTDWPAAGAVPMR